MDYTFSVKEKKTCYQGFFRCEQYRLSHALYAGGMSPEIVRELFERGHAVAVLLYDPHRDVVVMVEQFRIGALEFDKGAWMLEIVAGMIDEGESVEDVARRESLEESGCEVDRLQYIAEYLPSPGGCSEQIFVYCGRTDSSKALEIAGLEHEGEDILIKTLPAEEAIELAVSGKIYSSPALIALLWFALKRETLREEWLREA